MEPRSNELMPRSPPRTSQCRVSSIQPSLTSSSFPFLADEMLTQDGHDTREQPVIYTRRFAPNLIRGRQKGRYDDINSPQRLSPRYRRCLHFLTAQHQGRDTTLQYLLQRG